MRGWLTSDNVHLKKKKKNFIGDVWVTLAFPPLRGARALPRDRCWCFSLAEDMRNGAVEKKLRRVISVGGSYIHVAPSLKRRRVSGSSAQRR